MDGRKTAAEAARLTKSSNINEPELDMRRHEPVEAGALARIYGVIRKLLPDSRSSGSPMRSIARELEESWPTGE